RRHRRPRQGGGAVVAGACSRPLACSPARPGPDACMLSGRRAADAQGELSGVVGLFPVNYVAALSSAPGGQPPADANAASGGGTLAGSSSDASLLSSSAPSGGARAPSPASSDSAL